MKIAISASEQVVDAAVDSRFGRAPCFAIFDTESDEITFVDNTQVLNTPQGAGIQAAQNVLATGAGIVLTGNCGPKAFKVLMAAKAKVAVGVQGSLAEAIERYKAGQYEFTDEANVEGHWA